MVHDTAAGNIGTRMQGRFDLREAPRQWDDQGGVGISTGTWWRVEMTYDGHTTTWSSINLGTEMELTGYRWRRDAVLEWDSLALEVEDYQHKLIDLGYELPTWGPDGHYGQESADAFEAFQANIGLPVGAGATENGVGPETLAALDLAHAEDQGDPLPDLVYVSHLVVSEGPNRSVRPPPPQGRCPAPWSWRPPCTTISTWSTCEAPPGRRDGGSGGAFRGLLRGHTSAVVMNPSVSRPSP